MFEMKFEAHRFRTTRTSGEVSALLLRPDDARCLLLFGHGAGAGMRHAFMEQMSQRLAERRIATFRYQFPYMEQGRRRPDHSNMLLKTVRSAVASARGAGHLRLAPRPGPHRRGHPPASV